MSHWCFWWLHVATLWWTFRRRHLGWEVRLLSNDRRVLSVLALQLSKDWPIQVSRKVLSFTTWYGLNTRIFKIEQIDSVFNSSPDFETAITLTITQRFLWVFWTYRRCTKQVYELLLYVFLPIDHFNWGIAVPTELEFLNIAIAMCVKSLSGEGMRSLGW